MNESNLIDQIYSTAADPGRWPEVLVRLPDHLDAQRAMLVYCAPSGKGRTLQVLARLPGTELRSLDESRRAAQPGLRRGRRSCAGPAHSPAFSIILTASRAR
jgi:hypothetical protein